MVLTFITDDDPKVCARNLDYKRLGKQKLECKWIINSIESKKNNKHPGYLMWEGYLNYLKHYTNCIIEEWLRRGYKNTMEIYSLPSEFEKPWFFTYRPLQLTHICSLKRKDSNYYNNVFPNSPEITQYMTIGYLWPTKISLEILELMKKNKCENPKTYCQLLS